MIISYGEWTIRVPSSIRPCASVGYFLTRRNGVHGNLYNKNQREREMKRKREKEWEIEEEWERKRNTGRKCLKEGKEKCRRVEAAGCFSVKITTAATCLLTRLRTHSINLWPDKRRTRLRITRFILLNRRELVADKTFLLLFLPIHYTELIFSIHQTLPDSNWVWINYNFNLL